MGIGEGELYRIELGISHNLIRSSLYRVLKKECNKLGFSTIDDLRKGIRITHAFKSRTVNNFLIDNKIPEDKAYKLISISSDCKLKIRRGAKLKDLSHQEVRLLQFFIQMNRNKRILIETSGMYLNVLIATYDLLKEFLNQGGMIVEMAYPHFQEDDDRKWYATKKLKTFQIGEMQITK